MHERYTKIRIKKWDKKEVLKNKNIYKSIIYFVNHINKYNFNGDR